MNTILNGNLLSTFLASQPERIPLGTEYENKRWNSLWEFLKCKTNLKLYNTEQLSELNKLMLTTLCSGRNETTVCNIDKPFSSHNNKIKCENPLTYFCLNEKNDTSRNKYRNKNGYLFAFNDELFASWERLSLLPLKNKYSVRRGLEQMPQNFTSWSILENYLTPFTDAVIIDNYLLSDPSLIPSNFEKILVELDKATPVKYRLSIYTYNGGDIRPLIGKVVFDSILEIKKRLQLKCDIELIVAKGKAKEHDRGIFTNYLTIRSGDSFNYFNSKNEIITNGTDITFGSMADIDERDAAFITLSELGEKIEKIKSKNPEIVFENCNNQLIGKAVAWRKLNTQSRNNN